jgi:hypothetical protein
MLIFAVLHSVFACQAEVRIEITLGTLPGTLAGNDALLKQH